MRSRAVQLVLSAVAAGAVIGAALFTFTSEQHITTARTAERAFDAVVREATSSVAEFRGEGVAKSIGALRAMALTEKAKDALDQAAAKADNFTEIAAVLDQVNAARTAEQQAADDAEAAQRKLEATALGGAAVVVLIAIAGIVIATPNAADAVAPEAPAAAAPTAPATAAQVSDDLALRGEPASNTGYLTSRPAGPVLRAASQLCTDLGRVSDAEELRQLVSRGADLMDASGLIVWAPSPDGLQLVPAFTYGYSPEVLARFPPLAKSADNAAATAYRTGQLQIVLARPGASNGAIVAPVLSPEGCVGVISAEIRGGGETSESVQALAAIFAAQLAGVLHTTPDAHEQRATGT